MKVGGSRGRGISTRLARSAAATATLAVLVFLPAASTAPRPLASAQAKGVPTTPDCGPGMFAPNDPLTRFGATPACVPASQPESFQELAQAHDMMAARAGTRGVADGAYAAAVAQRGAMAADLSGNRAWQPVGNTPLFANDPRFPPYNKAGWVKLSGRITAFAYDPATPGRYFAAPAEGGVWETRNGGGLWHSIGETLPTQVMGALGWSPARGGTLIAASGDNATSLSPAYIGHGVFWSSDNGATWNAARNIPDGAVGFKVAVDPSDATGYILYAATSKGLFRSTNGGIDFSHVVLPVTPNGYPIDCNGPVTFGKCFLAQVVTDVVVRGGNGNVMAVVGWRLGNVHYKAQDGGTLDPTLVHSPRNGIYVSTDRGVSFTYRDGAGYAPLDNRGRTALGIAHGPNQNPDVVYALVQDALKLQGCLVDETDTFRTCATSSPRVTRLDGIYVTSDFGLTWNKIATANSLSLPGNNSAMSLASQPTNAPGVQAWYNEWIEVDPTRADSSKFPTRLLFGLEEIWQNPAGTPIDGSLLVPVPFQVIGRYWNACGPLTAGFGAQCNAAASPIPGTTTHPDQHAGILIPDGASGVTLLAGNDGGAYVQHVSAGAEFSNDRWGEGINDGMNTLLPYDLSIANDGTVVAGLQDNGQLKIEPNGRENMIYGGDAFYTGIDPKNSKNILEEYTNGAARVSEDGGQSWNSITFTTPAALFSTPISIDPLDPQHYIAGGNDIGIRVDGYRDHCFPDDSAPDPTLGCATGLRFNPWINVFNLGTYNDPGNKNSTAQSKTNPYFVASAVDLRGVNAYAAFCGPNTDCENWNQAEPFKNGIATNVGGATPPAPVDHNSATPDPSWHIAAAAGLPKRYITSIKMDPGNPRTVYATLAGYSRLWLPPGATGDDISQVGTGHVFKSTDAGATFTDISANLPDVPAEYSGLVNGRLLVATDIGVFISSDASGGPYSVLGTGLPVVPVVALKTKPDNPGKVYIATFGRGIYSYDFGLAGVTTPVAPAVQPRTSALRPLTLPNTSTLVAGGWRGLPLVLLAFILAAGMATFFGRRARP